MPTYYLGTGRRKTAVARVRLCEGSGRIFVNKKELHEYFPVESYAKTILEPLQAVKSEKNYDVFVNVQGGGKRGQVGAIRLGIARALAAMNEEFQEILREQKFLTRDARVKERKKYGRRGARRGFQFSKR